MDDRADQWLYDFDALAEHGLEDDPKAWEGIDRVDQLLALLARRTPHRDG